MKVLSIGNIFESYSMLVDRFCPPDSEITVNNLNSRISGAAIVVTAVAAFLKESASIITKGAMSKMLTSYLELLKSRKIHATVLPAVDSNILITIYDQDLYRKCYSYIPNSVNCMDLESFDYSEYDLVFLCCIPYQTVKDLFLRNRSIRTTCTVVLPSGLASSYFKEGKFQLNADYLFINRGELLNLFSSDMSALSSKALINKLDMVGTSIVITQGHKGIVGIVQDKYFEHSVHEITNIVHPGGAGDSFATGFMISLVKGLSISNCCEIGHQCASKMLSVFNTEEFLRGTNEIIWK